MEDVRVPLEDADWLDAGTPPETPAIVDDWCDLPEGRLVSLDSPHHGWTVFLPCHFEPGYAYPVFIWLPSSPSGRADLQRWFPLISNRNYVAVAAIDRSAARVGVLASRSGLLGRPAGETECSLPDLEEQIEAAIAAVSAQLPINTDRIFLAGESAAGAAALTVGLTGPRRFAGVAAINPGTVPLLTLLRSFRSLQGAQVLLASTLAAEHRGRREELADLLATAGVALVQHRADSGSPAERCAAAARAIDAWAMELVCRPAGLAHGGRLDRDGATLPEWRP
jgi:pimeloyl-ACP methyl ester carboxylesterase